MIKSRNRFSILFYITLIALTTRVDSKLISQSSTANLISRTNSFNFEQLTNHLFSENDLFESNYFVGQYNSSENLLECTAELNAIRKGLINFEQWAMKSKFVYKLWK